MADSWTDVAAHPAGGFVRAVSEAGAVRVEWDGILLWRTKVATDFLRFLRVAVSPMGATAVIGQSGEGNAIVVTVLGTTDIGLTLGMFPVALRFAGETLHTYRCGPGDFVPLYLDGVEITRTHQVEGIREVLANGTIVLGQSTAAGVFDGHNFGQYTRKDGWVVGQSGFTISCLHEASHQFFIARRGSMAEGIHFAVQGPTIAVVAFTEAGPFLKTFSPPYPVDVVDPPIDPPPPPPEKPMLPDPEQVKEALDRELKKFTAINNTMLGKVLNAVALQFPGMGMHRKDGEKSAPQPLTGIGMARDILRFLPPGDNIGFWSDVLGATGAGQAIPLAPDWKVSNDDSRSFVKPVKVIVDPPIDPPPPPPSGDPLEARVTALEAKVNRLLSILRGV